MSRAWALGSNRPGFGSRLQSTSLYPESSLLTSKMGTITILTTQPCEALVYYSRYLLLLATPHWEWWSLLQKTNMQSQKRVSCPIPPLARVTRAQTEHLACGDQSEFFSGILHTGMERRVDPSLVVGATGETPKTEHLGVHVGPVLDVPEALYQLCPSCSLIFCSLT